MFHHVYGSRDSCLVQIPTTMPECLGVLRLIPERGVLKRDIVVSVTLSGRYPD